MIDPSNCTPWHLSQRNENICSHKNLYTDVHSSIIDNTSNGKQYICPSIDECLNKLWYIHTMEYSAIKSKELLILIHVNNMDGSQEHYAN